MDASITSELSVVRFDGQLSINWGEGEDHRGVDVRYGIQIDTWFPLEWTHQETTYYSLDFDDVNKRLTYRLTAAGVRAVLQPHKNLPVSRLLMEQLRLAHEGYENSTRMQRILLDVDHVQGMEIVLHFQMRGVLATGLGRGDTTRR
jgi:hypothetical protein